MNYAHPSADIHRPDPDKLLAQIKQDSSDPAGKLHIYFGSNAGVGKTYSMLMNAQREQQLGRDIVIGIVETHGRQETIKQLSGLEVLPLNKLNYREKTLLEFDLDAALARHPEIILIDELAHSNVAGSRHAKRWQDVEELLKAGIEVWTTLNVQHLESLNDVVRSIVGVPIHETVPDHIFDTAHEVIMIDLPPDELLDRLNSGKIYAPKSTQHARQNFFRRGNLLALRELALRRTADRVDMDMRVYRNARSIDTVWPARERLLVGIGGYGSDERLVRDAARLAQKLGADWLAVYVDNGFSKHRDRHARALKTLTLAQQLGAQTAVLNGHDIAETLAQCAQERNANRLLLAHHPRNRWRFWHLSISDKISQTHPEIDQIILAKNTHKLQQSQKTKVASIPKKALLLHYVGASLASLATAVTASLLLQVFDLANVVMLFLLSVVIVALRFGRGPSIWAAMLNVLCLDFFFVAPHWSFTVNDTQYFFTFALMLGIALIIGQLTVRLRLEARTAAIRERRATSLSHLARELSAALTIEQVLSVAVHTFSGVFDAQVSVALPDENGRIGLAKGGMCEMDSNIAQWVYDNNQRAGKGTDTLSATPANYFPLKAPMRVRGVLVVQFSQDNRLQDPQELHLLETCMSQLAIALERVHFVDIAQKTIVQIEGERLRNTLLSSVSHDLKTPLTTIMGAADAAKLYATTQPLPALLDSIHSQALAMHRLIENLLDMARMQEDGPRLNMQWHSIEEIVGSVLRQLTEVLADHLVTTAIPVDLPLIEMDGLLIERALVNLLDNACKYTPSGSLISISAKVENDKAIISVMDNGPGHLTESQCSSIFDAFTRGNPESNVPGIGLGLALVKRIIEAHKGTISAHNRSSGGIVFNISLPVGQPPFANTEIESC